MSETPNFRTDTSDPAASRRSRDTPQTDATERSIASNVSFVERSLDRVPSSSNPFARFSSHLIWFILDTIAEYDTDCCKAKRGTDKGQPESGPSELGSFVGVVHEIQFAKGVDRTDPSDWVLSENFVARCRPLIERSPLGLHFSSAFETEYVDRQIELSVPFLTMLVDSTRRGSCPPLEPSDLSVWIGKSAEYLSTLEEPLELSELLDVLQSWLCESDRLASLMGSDCSSPRPLFRPLPGDLMPVAEELVSSFKKRNTNSRPFTESDALVALHLLSKDVLHRTVPGAEFKRAIKARVAHLQRDGKVIVVPTEERLSNLLTELFRRGYAENPPKHGEPDDDVIHLISRERSTDI